jgi:hypothetical protein
LNRGLGACRLSPHGSRHDEDQHRAEGRGMHGGGCSGVPAPRGKPEWTGQSVQAGGRRHGHVEIHRRPISHQPHLESGNQRQGGSRTFFLLSRLLRGSTPQY